MTQSKTYLVITWAVIVKLAPKDPTRTGQLSSLFTTMMSLMRIFLFSSKTMNYDPDEYSTDYVKKVYDVFQNNGVYKDKSKPNSRCVTIDYVGDFHIDVVPCIEYGNSQYICNRTKKEYERTDGDGYKKWLADKNRVVGGNFLKKSIRIFKFLRDHKDNFSIKSILLTTLIGNQVSVLDTNSKDFCDLPTTLKTLSNRMNDFLQKHPTMPIIKNPVLSEEDFNRKWDQSKYANFRDKFNTYNKKINCAFDEKEPQQECKEVAGTVRRQILAS